MEKGELLLSRQQLSSVLPNTILGMRRELNAGKTAVNKRLAEMREAKLVYRSGFEGSASGYGSSSAVFSLGPGPDVPGPGEPGYVHPKRNKTQVVVLRGRNLPVGPLGDTYEFISEVRNRWPQGPFAALFNYNEVEI